MCLKKIVVTYNVPGAKKNNQSLNLVDTVPAAQGTKAIFKKTLNIQGYTLDLTGPNQNSYNKLAVNFLCPVKSPGISKHSLVIQHLV